jgi:hypothetical protein
MAESECLLEAHTVLSAAQVSIFSWHMISKAGVHPRELANGACMAQGG